MYRCSTKGAAQCSFHRALKSSYFEKVLLRNFDSTWNILLKHYISAEFLLMEGYVQGALRKEPFVERFKTTTLRKSYWQMLLLLATIYLDITFLPNVC